MATAIAAANLQGINRGSARTPSSNRANSINSPRSSPREPEHLLNRTERLPQLTSSNYIYWLERVNLYLYAMNCQSCFEKSTVINGVEQTGRCHPDIPDYKRRHAYVTIKSSLPMGFFDTLKDVNIGEVEEILRRIRLFFYKSDTNTMSFLMADLRELKLSKHADAEAYIIYALNLFDRLRDIAIPQCDRVKIHHIRYGLPLEYEVFKLSMKTCEDCSAYCAELRSYAASSPHLPGSTHSARVRTDRANVTKDSGHSKPKSSLEKSKEACNKFKAGRCTFGDKCKYMHDPAATKSTDTTSTFVKCTKTKCNSKRHKPASCWLLHPELRPASEEGKEGKDKANVIKDDEAVLKNSIYDDIVNMHSEVNSAKSGSFMALLDGGATCNVLLSSVGCHNIRPCNKKIKSATCCITCHELGDLTCYTIVNGIEQKITLADCRIIPEFSSPIISERYFLKLGKHKVDKEDDDATIIDNHGKIILHAQAGKDGLFYTELSLEPNILKSAYTTDYDVAVYYQTEPESYERCHHCGSFDQTYIARCYSEGNNTQTSQLRLLHERLGHRNIADVAKISGITLPLKPMFCRACVEGKSSRLSFNHQRIEPFYNAPRPGYAWHTDTVGPFSTSTLEGEQYSLVFVCGYSRRIRLFMTKSPSEFDPIWENHCATMETEANSTRLISNLVSDGAKYSDTQRLRAFNLQKGIVHLVSPPYTQELNHIAERCIRTIIEMARSMLIHCGAPKAFHGDAQTYSAYLLNRLPWKRGATQSRLERYFKITIRDSLRHARVFGCAVWVHQSHPTGAHQDKLDAKWASLKSNKATSAARSSASRSFMLLTAHLTNPCSPVAAIPCTQVSLTQTLLILQH